MKIPASFAESLPASFSFHGSLSALDFYKRFNLKRIICEPKPDGEPHVLTHVAASSELSVVCELNRYEILRDIAERYAGALDE